MPKLPLKNAQGLPLKQYTIICGPDEGHGFSIIQGMHTSYAYTPQEALIQAQQMQPGNFFNPVVHYEIRQEINVDALLRYLFTHVEVPSYDVNYQIPTLLDNISKAAPAILDDELEAKVFEFGIAKIKKLYAKPGARWDVINHSVPGSLPQ